MRVSAAKETKKRIRDSDVIEAVRLVLAVASEKLSLKQPTTEMNALDFSEVMRMKRERGEMREVLA